MKRSPPSASRNPFLYRGYYYDYDLGFYVTGTRYYDPKVGRFINADSALYHDLLGYNMYAYCENNPVNYVDYTGESAQALKWIFTLPMLDGALPVGDLLFLGAVLVITSRYKRKNRRSSAVSDGA